MPSGRSRRGCVPVREEVPGPVDGRGPRGTRQFRAIGLVWQDAGPGSWRSPAGRFLDAMIADSVEEADKA